MNEKDLRLKRCCFTGHRPEKLDISPQKIKHLLDKHIDSAIKKGYITFISGMARGVDMWAAEIVLKKRKYNKNIHLICAVPYQGFEKSWDVGEQNIYNNILKQADMVRYISPHYSSFCFQKRNIWMVDHSALVIAVYNGTKGGTLNTINYALKNNICVDNILT